MPAANAVPPHTHDERYVTKWQEGVSTGATRTVFGQQRRWTVHAGHSLLLPDVDIEANAEIVIEDGAELALVGGGVPGHHDLFDLADGDDHTQYLLASTYGGRSAFGTNWTDLTDAGATTLHKHDHGGQDGLTDDDHTQYALLAGRSGGQSLIGGTAANDDLTLEGTSNATRTTSYVILQPNGGNVGIGTTDPGTAQLYINSAGDTNLSVYSTIAASTPKIVFGNATRIWDFLLNGTGGQLMIRDISAGNLIRMTVDTSGNVGIGSTGPGGKLEVNQASTTAAIPTVVLKQADVSEEFIEFNGTVSAGNPIDTAALGAYYGKIRVSVNGTFKYIALYDS